MAENESLDLADPGGQRWRHVLDAVKKRKSPKDVARQIELKLPKALRKAFKEFTEKGVTFEQLLENRNDQRKLQQLARKCGSHEYANLFAETAAISMGKTNEQLLISYFNGMVDRVADQITHKVAGAEWPNIPDVQALFSETRRIIKSDMERLAEKLAKDPSWKPSTKPQKRRDKVEETKDLLGVSLLGERHS